MFDIGVNLTSSQFAKDRAAVLERAKEAGVEGMLITGTHLKASQDALKLAQQHVGYCWSTAGVHPHDASTWSESVEQNIRRLAENEQVVAIGECGLDFNRNFSTPEQQEHAFIAQLALAAELKMPLFLHCRDAHKRFLELLTPYLPQIPGAVVHCFTDDRAALDAYLLLGLHIGITGWVCDERRGMALRRLMAHIPADKLLLETDAPYLLPRDLQPKPTSRRNEPCYLPHIVTQVAKLRGEDPHQLGRTTTANACRLFNLILNEENLL
jgi:TatD DNase family protein